LGSFAAFGFSVDMRELQMCLTKWSDYLSNLDMDLSKTDYFLLVGFGFCPDGFNAGLGTFGGLFAPPFFSVPSFKVLTCLLMFFVF
jgi:hypothetical protein